ncbi:ube1-prov protein [Aphelenchoides avenae]|nr:ube1-prov protein [Aphelenchus avenae]
MTEVPKRQSGTVAPEITEPPAEDSTSPGVVQTNTEPPSKRPEVTEVAGVESNSTYEAKNNMGGKPSSDNKGQPPAANGAEKNGTGEKLDHNLCSRQIYALGESAMQHVRKSAVLISGLGGTGVETAKKLILAGVRHVTIHDTKVATWHDLSSQFYLTEADLGKNRAAASFERLAELNDGVQCTLHTEALTETFVSQFDLIVLTEAPHAEQLRIMEWTRQHGKQLIVADARGLFAYIFVDLGERFRIDDANGEQSREVLTLEKVMHGFEDGDHVTFSEAQGMPEINDHEPIPIKVTKPNVFTIGEVARNFSEYKEGGRARQAKVPKYVNFKSLVESLKNPDYLLWDFAKFEAPAQLHALSGKHTSSSEKLSTGSEGALSESPINDLIADFGRLDTDGVAYPLISSVWIPDPEKGFIEIEIPAGDDVTVVTAKGNEQTLKKELVREMNSPKSEKTEGMSNLAFLLLVAMVPSGSGAGRDRSRSSSKDSKGEKKKNKKGKQHKPPRQQQQNAAQRQQQKAAQRQQQKAAQQQQQKAAPG